MNMSPMGFLFRFFFFLPTNAYLFSNFPDKDVQYSPSEGDLAAWHTQVKDFLSKQLSPVQVVLYPA